MAPSTSAKYFCYLKRKTKKIEDSLKGINKKDNKIKTGFKYAYANGKTSSDEICKELRKHVDTNLSATKDEVNIFTVLGCFPKDLSHSKEFHEIAQKIRQCGYTFSMVNISVNPLGQSETLILRSLCNALGGHYKHQRINKDLKKTLVESILDSQAMHNIAGYVADLIKVQIDASNGKCDVKELKRKCFSKISEKFINEKMAVERNFYCYPISADFQSGEPSGREQPSGSPPLPSEQGSSDESMEFSVSPMTPPPIDSTPVQATDDFNDALASLCIGTALDGRGCFARLVERVDLQPSESSWTYAVADEHIVSTVCYALQRAPDLHQMSSHTPVEPARSSSPPGNHHQQYGRNLSNLSNHAEDNLRPLVHSSSVPSESTHPFDAMARSVSFPSESIDHSYVYEIDSSTSFGVFRSREPSESIDTSQHMYPNFSPRRSIPSENDEIAPQMASVSHSLPQEHDETRVPDENEDM